MTQPPSPPPNAPDDNHDSTGWDNAPQSAGAPWHPPLMPPPPPRKVRWYVSTRLKMMISLIVLALVVFWYRMENPPLTGESLATNDTAAICYLKAIATAQAQYIKKTDGYACGGKDLNAKATLIGNDLKNAFENWQSNGDSTTPRPHAGYLYRMLQGDFKSGLTGYHKEPNNPEAGMDTWGATCRPSIPGKSGEYQYFITEAGTVYKFADPPPGDPHFNQFLLDRVPSLKQMEWVVAK